MFLFGCGSNTDSIEFFGYYVVIEENSGIEFSVTTDGKATSVTFNKPEVLTGMTAKTLDGNEYIIEYNGLVYNGNAKSVALVRDFVAAITTLDCCGNKSGNKYTAKLGDIESHAKIKNDKISEVVYKSNKTTRVFIINGDDN